MADDVGSYFVHGYYVKAYTLPAGCGVLPYGIDFVADMAKGSCFVVQFHPENSHTNAFFQYIIRLF